MLSYLIYVSTAVKPMSLAELEQLGAAAARNNLKLDVTGILLYDSKRFLQVLEGDRSVLDVLYNKIKKDIRHTNVQLLIVDKIALRNFPHWGMKVKDISSSDQTKSILFPDDISNPSAYISLVYRLLSNTLNDDFRNIKIYDAINLNSAEIVLFRSISKREKQVLELIVKGYTAKKIAKVLTLSEKTIARHTENISDKLNCATKSDLIMKVFSSGYISELLNH
jgi:DNA-binding CsgD family transcriptional regulator